MKYYLTWNDSKQIKVMHCHHDALDQFKTEQNPLFIRWLKAEEVSAANNIYGGGRHGGPSINRTPKFTWNTIANLGEEEQQHPNPPKNNVAFVSASEASGIVYTAHTSTSDHEIISGYQSSAITSDVWTTSSPVNGH